MRKNHNILQQWYRTGKWFSYRYWWLVLLAFVILLLLYFLFCSSCNDKSKERVQLKHREIRKKIELIHSMIDSCCNCPSDLTINPKLPIIAPTDPDTRLPCNVGEIRSGEQGVTKISHSLGFHPGYVYIDYNLFERRDRMDVYYDNKLVASTGGFVSETGKLKWYYNADKNKPDFCIIVITAPESGTKWEYQISCPE